MDAIVSLLGTTFVLTYGVGVIALTVYIVLLVRRHVLAQERIAAAVERIAQQSGPAAGESPVQTDPGASA